MLVSVEEWLRYCRVLDGERLFKFLFASNDGDRGRISRRMFGIRQA